MKAIPTIVFLLVAHVSLRADILLSLDAPSQAGHPGSVTNFYGTLNNLGSDEVFLDGIGATFGVSDLTLDDTSFFTLVPASLVSGDSYHGLIFKVLIDSSAQPDIYGGQITILGGSAPFTYDNIATADFTVTVLQEPTPVPEPSGALLVLSSLVVILLWRRRPLSLVPRSAPSSFLSD